MPGGHRFFHAIPLKEYSDFAKFAKVASAKLLICFAVALTVAGTAHAQAVKSQTGADPRRQKDAAKITSEAAPDDAKGAGDPERVDDSYQPKGVELGQFLLFPQLEVEEGYNSNVFASRSNPQSDFITRVAPELRLRSRFKEHSLNLLGRIEAFRFARFSDDDHIDGQFFADGRYDLNNNWEATGLLDFSKRAEDRGSPDAAGGKEPTPTYTTKLQTGTKIREGRYTFQAGFTASRLTFGDVETSTGATVDNSLRDRWEFLAQTRASYEMFPGYAAVGEISVNKRQYDSTYDASGYQRSSQGYRADVGVGVDISQLIRGDFLIGFLSQDYKDPRLKDPSGASVKAVFNWTPSRLTVVVPSLERSVQETTSRGASGMVRTGVSLVVRHELERNIVLTAITSVNRDDFKGTNQTNWTYEGRLRGIWALAPEYYVGAELGYRQRTSNVQSSEYQQLVSLLRFGVRM